MLKRHTQMGARILEASTFPCSKWREALTCATMKDGMARDIPRDWSEKRSLEVHGLNVPPGFLGYLLNRHNAQSPFVS